MTRTRELCTALALIFMFGGGLTVGIASRYPIMAQAIAQTRSSPADQAWDDAATKEVVVETQAAEANLALLRREKPTSSRSQLFELVEAYRQGAQSPETTKGLVARSLNTYHFNKAGARSAAQVTQAASEAGIQMAVIQIQQNQRIIGLLEQLAAKK